MLALVSSLLAFTSPITAIFLLLLIKDEQSGAFLRAISIALAFAILFYGMTCDAQTDLFRHIENLPNYRYLSFSQALVTGHNQELVIWNAWNWLIAQIGDPRLLQSSAAFIGYFIIAYICFDYCNKLGLSWYCGSAAFTFAFCAIPTFPLVTGIRSTVATLIVALAVYMWFEKGSHFLCAMAMCVIACLIHPVALFPALLFLFVNVVHRPRSFHLACVLIGFLGIASLSESLLRFIPSDGSIGSFLAGALGSLLKYEGISSWTAGNVVSFNGRANLIVTVGLAIVSLSGILFCNSKKLGTIASLSKMDFFSVQVLISSLALTVILPIQGGRFLSAGFTIAAPCCIQRAITGKSSAYTVGVLFFASAALVLHIYSMLYGQAFDSQLLNTALFGLMGMWL